jgi:hypothetical protein
VAKPDTLYKNRDTNRTEDRHQPGGIVPPVCPNAACPVTFRARNMTACANRSRDGSQVMSVAVLDTDVAVRSSVNAALLPIMAVVFIGFLIIGMALPVLPLHVHHDLHLTTFVVLLPAWVLER